MILKKTTKTTATRTTKTKPFSPLKTPSELIMEKREGEKKEEENRVCQGCGRECVIVQPCILCSYSCCCVCVKVGGGGNCLSGGEHLFEDWEKGREKEIELGVKELQFWEGGRNVRRSQSLVCFFFSSTFPLLPSGP